MHGSGKAEKFSKNIVFFLDILISTHFLFFKQNFETLLKLCARLTGFDKIIFKVSMNKEY